MSEIPLAPGGVQKRRIRWIWGSMTALALVMAAYGAAYLVFREAMFPETNAPSFLARPWGIYSHAFFGMLTIAIGPFQFYGRTDQRGRWHRWLGKIYLVAAVGTGVSGFYMAIYSYGGWITHIGFSGMAAAMLFTTLMAYQKIRAGRIQEHRAWMTRSYAVMFSAVTFRLWLGTLTAATLGNFLAAYSAASWLSWVLNLIWAEAYLRRAKPEASKVKRISINRAGKPAP